MIDRRQPDKLAALRVALEAEGSRAPTASRLAIELPNVAAFIVVDHHLDALALVGAAQKEAGIHAPGGVLSHLKFEVADLLTRQQNAAVPRAWRILLAGEHAAFFDSPVTAGAVADLLRIAVPALE